MGGSKPSFTEQKNVPNTDRKFRADDQHLVAREKEDVALSPHGDKLHPKFARPQKEEGDIPVSER